MDKKETFKEIQRNKKKSIIFSNGERRANKNWAYSDKSFFFKVANKTSKSVIESQNYCCHSTSKNNKISFETVHFKIEIYLILNFSLENFTTGITSLKTWNLPKFLKHLTSSFWHSGKNNNILVSSFFCSIWHLLH